MAHQICSTCLPEIVLSNLINKEGKTSQCSYCDKEKKTLTLNHLKPYIHKGIYRKYLDGASEGLFGYNELGRSPEDVLVEELELDSEQFALDFINSFNKTSHRYDEPDYPSPFCNENVLFIDQLSYSGLDISLDISNWNKLKEEINYIPRFNITSIERGA